MSPVESYYVVYDALCHLHGYSIKNDHPLAKHLGLLLRLANQAEHQEDDAQ